MSKTGPKPVDPRAIRAWKKHRPTSPMLLAMALEITGPAVSKWRYVPKDRVAAVAQQLGLKPEDLRPDLLPWEQLSKGTR
jgi:DNA-binding transcriptional regulator YdaS (Cro superfamily)